MEAIKAYYDGHAFFPTEPVSVKKNQSVTLKIVDEVRENRTQEVLLSLAGSLSEQSYQEYQEALKDCERIDADEW